MSTLDVKLRKLEKIEPHPNADKLELAVIGGYRAVVQKGIHKEGDLILYIPEDAMFTDSSIVASLRIGDYLTGKSKNRVKAIKLRGVLSQGIVLPFSVLDEVLPALGFGYPAHQEGNDFAEFFKIEKYEEDIPITMRGMIRKWPSFLPHYDVENVKKPEYINVLQEGEDVFVTEKLHGTNMAVAIGPELSEGEEAFICSRNNAILEDESNVYWKATRKYDLIEKLKKIKTMIEVGGQRCENISLHGEVVGVQDLKYGFSKGDVGFFAFDIRINNEYVKPNDFMGLCDHFDIPMVPWVSHGPYSYQKMCEWAEGKSQLSDHIKEGIVVKPADGRTDEYGVRIQFKFISEQYLTRKGGSELH